MNMQRRATSTHVVIIHGRQIVMNETETMNQFEGGGGGESGFRAAAQRCAGKQGENRSKPLSTRQAGIMQSVLEVFRQVQLLDSPGKIGFYKSGQFGQHRYSKFGRRLCHDRIVRSRPVLWETGHLNRFQDVS